MSSFGFKRIRRFTIAEGKPRHRAFPSAVKLSSGEILVAFREGTDHWVTDDGVVKIVRSSDGGVIWSEPELVFSKEGWSCASHHGMRQLSDGRILLPMTLMRHIAERREVKAYLLTSADGGQSWGKPLMLGPGEGKVWQNQCGRVQELPDGRILIPGGVRRVGEEKCACGYSVSCDGGQTFPEWVDIASGLADEADIARTPDGRLVAMIRDLREPYALHRCYSDDEGRSWGAPEMTSVLGQCPSFLALPSGTLLLGYRQVDTSRPYGCSISASSDGGKTWQLVSDVYVGTNWDCAYPSMVLLEGGQILCVYYTSFESGNSDIEGIVFEVGQ